MKSNSNTARRVKLNPICATVTPKALLSTTLDTNKPIVSFKLSRIVPTSHEQTNPFIDQSTCSDQPCQPTTHPPTPLHHQRMAPLTKHAKGHHLQHRAPTSLLQPPRHHALCQQAMSSTSHSKTCRPAAINPFGLQLAHQHPCIVR